ncbi:YfjI family protein [Thauera sinica]|uniref:YfjI family protein n=1 Tax=Thauera sinica TaxID=2665146 RepID=A0ABW1ASG0_9RHOO|nr:YfjI family protein [Thauera sp. K11]ATE58982.1 hypothetical protein CCZ27_02515 [Thauera sp. K11]
MNAPFLNQQYPIDAFPHIVEDALIEVNGIVQAPMSMTALSFLSSMSAIIQRVADVRLPTGQVKPASIFALVVAESGERKTAIDELIASPIREHDEAEERRFVKHRDNFVKAIDRWQSTRTAHIKRMSKLAEKGEPTDMIEHKLVELDTIKPMEPRLRRLVRQDMTNAALMSALEGDGEAVFVNASEGDVALKSDLMQQHFATLNMAWGGESILTDRATDSRTATNPRCTLSVMVQHEVLEKFMMKRGDVLRSSGFLARCLVTRPMSMIGNRFVLSEPPQWKHLDVFHARLRNILEEGDLRLVADVPRRTMEFDNEARRQWASHANKVETMLREGDYLYEVRDFGAKLMEHVARVAAILHVFSCQEGKITVDTVERAFSIVWFHAEEFRLLFSPSLEVPQAVIDAEKIERYLLHNVWMNGWDTIHRNEMHRIGPVRGLDRFVPAIDVLVSQGRIWITQAHRKAPLVVNLNPAFFNVPRLM